MCFYNQYQFACGDLTRNLRRRCDRVYPQENSCGSEIASEIFHLQNKCSLCSRIATYRRCQQREWDRIKELESKEQVDGEAVQRSIGIINQLQSTILALELKRRDQRITVPEDNAENNESASLGQSASLGPAVESADLLTPSKADTVTNFDSLAPLNKLEDGYEEDDFSPTASPSTARAIDARQVAEWKARKGANDNETLLAKTSQGKLL